MGFFSWITQDTGRSICNTHSGRKTFKVVMSDNKGHQWVELDYGGYGIFGGKDYYVLLDEMNGGDGDRNEGIRLAFADGDENTIYPSLTESGAYMGGAEPEHCDAQGCFYDDEWEDDEYEDYPFDTYHQAVSDWEWK